MEGGSTVYVKIKSDRGDALLLLLSTVEVVRLKLFPTVYSFTKKPQFLEEVLLCLRRGGVTVKLCFVPHVEEAEEVRASQA